MTPAKKAMPAKPVAAKKSAAAKKKVAAPKKEAAVAAAPAAQEALPMAPPASGYVYALGRRKSAIAQTRLWPTGKGEIKVNEKPYDQYFTVYEQREIVLAPLKATGQDASVNVHIKTYGGGMRGQSEAARLGISRALIELNPAYRASLKQLGYLTRDPREKERKKYGLKKARKGPQWAKR
jgi:small subunit ribosomal protein S9